MPVPVISVAEMREWERATWATGQTEDAVIAQVGEALARRARELTRPGDRLLLLAGKGHNGDDVRAMMPHLSGRDAQLFEISNPVMALAQFEERLKPAPDLIVDGLFGIGLNRPLDHDWLHLIARINHEHARVLAVDVPSGVNAETGEVETAAIHATETATVGVPKRGLLATHAARYVGRLTVLTEVGLAPLATKSELQWTLENDFARFPPARNVTGHKGTYGHLGIIAGSIGYHGAGILSARGAQRARPGLITVLPQPEVYQSVAAQLQSPMVQPWSAQFDRGRFTGLLIGPGLAGTDLPASLRQTVRRLWVDYDQPVVVDASALEWLPEGQFAKGACRVITPHPGEAAQLLGIASGEVQADRIGALRKLSARFGNCFVVLKGHQTLIGRTSGEVFVNSTGGPGLAQGGSGDVLAGFLAGWMAQPQFHADPLMAIRYAVWEHGAAADRLNALRGQWIVEELAQELGRHNG